MKLTKTQYIKEINSDVEFEVEVEAEWCEADWQDAGVEGPFSNLG